MCEMKESDHTISSLLPTVFPDGQFSDVSDVGSFLTSPVLQTVHDLLRTLFERTGISL